MALFRQGKGRGIGVHKALARHKAHQRHHQPGQVQYAQQGQNGTQQGKDHLQSLCHAQQSGRAVRIEQTGADLRENNQTGGIRAKIKTEMARLECK